MISLSVKEPKLDFNVAKVKKRSLFQATALVRREASRNAPYKSGTLRRSIKEEVRGDRGYVGTNLIYAAVHEFGAVIKPKSKKYLTFKIGGRWVRTKRVKIPKRPYLTPALEDNVDRIKNIFLKNMERLLTK